MGVHLGWENKPTTKKIFSNFHTNPLYFLIYLAIISVRNRKLDTAVSGVVGLEVVADHKIQTGTNAGFNFIRGNKMHQSINGMQSAVWKRSFRWRMPMRYAWWIRRYTIKKILKNQSSQDFFNFIYCVSRKLPRPRNSKPKSRAIFIFHLCNFCWCIK